MSERQPLTDPVFETWANDPRGPVALHLRQKLMPVEGEDAVIFPPTYAMKDNATPYVIDTLSDGTKVAQVDSVGAQANRMEPLFDAESDYGDPELANLVPQIRVNLGNAKTVSILEAGHRLGDALIRSTKDLADQAKSAFADFADHADASAIARLAPTSLVFGAWDSRGDSQAKLPRLVNATVRAWDVEELRRRAQYIPPVDYAKLDVFSPEEQSKSAGNPKTEVAQRGFVHVPAEDRGGVLARGGIYRDVTVNLVALRKLKAGRDAERSGALRRYILGLTLAAAAAPLDGFLRQGCLLTPAPDTPADWTAVARTGERQSIDLSFEAAKALATHHAEAFGIAPGGTFDFETKRAKADLRAKSGRA